MQIVKIDPDAKYILVVPEGTQEQVEKLVEAISAFKQDDVHTILFIYGLKATLVPADQVVGYTTFEPEGDKDG